MNLALRNRIAEWMLEALEGTEHEAPVRALADFAERVDDAGFAPGLGALAVTALHSDEDLFEAAGDGIRLRRELLSDLPALRERARRFVEALDRAHAACGEAPVRRGPKRPAEGSSAPGADELRWTISAAAALFESRLFFEVHEILEPLWGRADGPLRSFLQGLIQIAVGFHHHDHGNLRGALSLLREGNARLTPLRPAAFGVELEKFSADVERLVREVERQLGGGTVRPLDPIAFRV